jgi:clan AA aspartic protease
VYGSVVSDGREASVSIEIMGTGSDRDTTNFRAIIDTGFTGHLTLPPETVRSLSLPERGFVEVELADGGMATLRAYETRVLWHGRPRRVPVYEADGGPLIGMSLLRGSTLTVDVIPGGEVAIAERSEDRGV